MIVTGNEIEFIYGIVLEVGNRNPRAGYSSTMLIGCAKEALGSFNQNLIYSDVVVITRRDWDRIQKALGETEIK